LIGSYVVKTLLNPLIVSAFIAVMVLGSLTHLMYGSCQASKLHYMIQEYKMLNHLPSWLLFKDKPSNTLFSSLNGGYNGKWESWYEDGNKKFVGDYVYGLANGLMETWYENGVKEYHCYWSMGMVDGNIFEWYRNGKIKLQKEFKKDMLISKKYWNEDGTLDQIEFYDPNGNCQKIELYEKGKLVKAEVVELRNY